MKAAKIWRIGFWDEIEDSLDWRAGLIAMC